MEYYISLATYIGTNHRQVGCPCQDKVSTLQQGGVWAAALSDGAGSRAHSHVGAELVTQVVSQFLVQRFDWCWVEEPREIARVLLEEILLAFDAEVRYSRDDMACTLIGYGCHEDGRHIALHLGDGAIISSNDEIATILSPPENGLHRNETIFVTTPDGVDHLRIQRREVQGSGGVLLMSDGMSESLYHYQSGAPAPACNRIFQWMQKELGTPLDSVFSYHMETLFSKQTSDDLSLIAIAW